MPFFSVSGQMNWYWKWHFLCVLLHPLLLMYMAPLELLRSLLCQEWTHRVANLGVMWLVLVQLCCKWIWSIIFLSISDGARAYSRHVLSRWSKHIYCDQLWLRVAFALMRRDSAHPRHARLCTVQNWSHSAHGVSLHSIHLNPGLFAICIFLAHRRCLAAAPVQGTVARRKPYSLISS